MNNLATTSKSNQNVNFNDDDDEIFDDSTFLANFENSSFKRTMLSENNINDSLNNSAFNISALCCDEEISGYDKLTGKTWIYPTNYPVRDYQFNIIKAAILKNTLVSLPTGLGKTFIAAVIMYNFYRWYPLGKIVFTAPTRPLVAQQIEACYDIVAIPPNDTIEMTGHMHVTTRKVHWQNKRVVFATPQVIYNDIKSGICPGDKIRCLVIDEAHRARKNYAYCQIVSALDDMKHKIYRMLALSATPGSKIEDVVSVVNNLHIAHLELRTEDCIDVAPYSHSRKISTVIVPLGEELSQLRQQYVEILDGYARRLKQLNILPQNLGNLSKGRVVMLYKEFQTKDRGTRHPQHNYIMKDFTILIALFHGLELLVKHGSRVFLNFFDEHPEKSWIQADDKLTALLERLRDDLGINPLSLDTSILPDGTIPEIPKNLCFGHPKFDKLKEIMIEHFTTAKRKGQDTRAIVFCEYRESVNLVHCLLLQCRPLINSQMFVGQGASGKDGKTVVSQKQQLRVMRSFRAGASNALVATCVAEEGLDVGAVHLILCFDISNTSPIRLVQRCGRTGRERDGQVYILVTEGREHQTLMDCMRQRDGLNKKILQSKEVRNSLYKMNPRLIPHDFTPQCQKMHITVTKKSNSKDKDTAGIEKTGQKDLRAMLLGRGSTTSSNSLTKQAETNIITKEEFKELCPDGYRETADLTTPQEYWAMKKDAFKLHKEEQSQLKLYKWLEWQRNLQKYVNIGHSKDTVMLTELLQYSDAKRFEMPPSTQNPTFNTQDLATQNTLIPSTVKTKQSKKKIKATISKSPAKKDGDIRALFSTATKSTKSYTKLISDLGIQNDGSTPTSLINLLVDLSLDNTNEKKCYICENLCDCALIQYIRKGKKKSNFSLKFVTEPKLPNIDLIDDFDADTIIRCGKNTDQIIDSVKQNIPNANDFGNKNKSCNNFELELDFDSPVELNSPQMAEKDVVNLDTSDNFDIGHIDDIFANSSPEEATEKNTEKEIKVEKYENKEKEALGFFGLDSIDDIFADYDESIENFADIPKTKENIKQHNKSTLNDTTKSPKRITEEQNTNANTNPKLIECPISPSILSGRTSRIPSSPILCSQTRKFQLSTKKKRPQNSTPLNSKKRLELETANNTLIVIPDDKEHNSCIRNNTVDSNKSMFTITQLVNMINKTNDSDKSVANESTTTEINKKNLTTEEKRSVSPILLTQSDRKKSTAHVNNLSKVQSKKNESLIILDSDSDSNDTLLYDLEDDIDKIGVESVIKERLIEVGKAFNKDTQIFELENETGKTITDINEKESLGHNKNKPIGNEFIGPTSSNSTLLNNNISSSSKRKLEIDDSDIITTSPYFINKKRKITANHENKEPTSLEKVLAAISSNKTNHLNSNHTTTFNFTVSQPCFTSQKENNNPLNIKNEDKRNSDDEKECVKNNNLEMLQMYKCDSKLQQGLRNKFNTIFNNTNREKMESPQKRKIVFDDSDDDFFIDDKNRCQNPRQVNGDSNRSTINHKERKKSKKRNKNSFLDLEAVLSDDEYNSGDELSDDSIGSIADFICDENVSNHENMHALYLKSVRSPVKGGFKIPQLPKKFRKEDVLSQYVEEDAYEMDSFCVDSHIGLTQVNDVSELELAEILLEEERKAKKYTKEPHTREKDDSPLIKRRKKNANRRIHSDSEDST